ncbi:MAG: nuclease-related domain-containing protein [Wenzhouxiangellaceae bacterium]
MRHRKELREAGRLRRRRLLVAIPVLVALSFGAFSLSPPFGLFVAAVGAGVLFFLGLPGSSSVDAGALAGIEGEVAVLERLKTLPDDFLLLNRVKLPDGQLPNGWRELDFVVAGPDSLWIVEVKNTPGYVYVQPGERHWPLARRAGCGSRPSWNALENPIPQTNAQVQSLKRWLLQQGVSVEPKAVICLSHPEVAVENGTDSPVPVLVRDQLTGHIQTAPSAAMPGGLVDTLAQLRPGNRSAMGGEKHDLRDRAAPREQRLANKTG